MPDVYKSYEARDLGQEAVQRGVKAAAAAAPGLDADTLTPEALDADAAEALALAVIIQSWDFIRDGAWDKVDEGVLPLVLSNIERDHRLVPPLREILEEHGGDVDRTPVLNKLGSLERHLAQYAREGRRLLDELGLEEVSESDDLDDDEPISFDSMGDLPEAAPPTKLDPPKAPEPEPEPEEPSKPATIGQTMRSALNTEELRVRQADDKAADADVKADKLRRFRRVGFVTIGVLFCLAVVSILPMLRIGAPPSIGTYEDHLPITGVIRPSDSNVPYMVVMVGREWDGMPVQQRTTGLQSLFEHVLQNEEMQYIVVRSRDGLDSARIDSGGVDHYR